MVSLLKVAKITIWAMQWFPFMIYIYSVLLQLWFNSVVEMLSVAE